jgi:hypothetical protein
VVAADGKMSHIPLPFFLLLALFVRPVFLSLSSSRAGAHIHSGERCKYI